LFERAAAAGKRVTLEVLQGNPAKQLYLRLGPEKTPTRSIWFGILRGSEGSDGDILARR